MKRKLFGGLLFTAMLCFIMCTVVMAEDVPMTEEEITYVEESFSVETEAEEELIVAEEEEEFLEADGLVEDDEVLEAAEDFDFNTAIPDSTFQTFLKAKGLTSLDTISMATELVFAGMGIEDLTGIKYFTNLQTLDCSGNKLAKLDVSGLTSLEVLYCDKNQLTSLNVNGCTNLEKFFCYKNNLSSIDVSDCTNLKSLLCNDNQLTNLDLHKCTKLSCLYCYNNNLTSLDVSFCPKLKECCENSTPSLVNSSNFNYHCYESEDDQFGVDPDVNIITDSTFSEGDVYIDEATFPDKNFREFLISEYTNGGLVLKRSTISDITELDIDNRGIEDLTGIKYFTNLQRLYCTDNKLTKLDVSGLSSLKELDCDYNQLMSLDVSGCTSLKELYCRHNELTSLDVSGLTSLEVLVCNSNGLSSLNVSGCAGLDNINCGTNHLTSLDVSGCTALTTLRCLKNELTSLDLSNCTALDYLMCYTNQLTKLNVSGCTALEYLSCEDNQLTSLDVSGCKMLELFLCEDNQLTSLDVSKCTSLKALYCEENLLTILDVSFCEEIRNLCNTTEPTIENGYLVYRGHADLVIDPAVRVLTTHEHVWDDGVVTKEATTTEEGIKTYTCIFAGCRQTKTESIPKIIEPPQENITLTEQITISKKPTIKKPTATKSKITVNWKHFKHTSKKTKPIWKKIKKVQVQCATDSAFTNIVKSTMVGKKKTKAAIKGLAKKTTYYVRVRYYDGTGYSAWSKVKKVKTK